MKQRAAGGAVLDVSCRQKFEFWKAVGLGWLSRGTLKSLLVILSEGKLAGHGGNKKKKKARI